jgi:hypothetical protein
MSIEYQIVYWRDIPAQIKIRGGRERLGRELSERFQKAIDWAAMAAGVTSTDGYLDEWRTSDWLAIPGEPVSSGLPEAAEQLIHEIEKDYPPDRLQTIMINKGFNRL